MGATWALLAKPGEVKTRAWRIQSTECRPEAGLLTQGLLANHHSSSCLVARLGLNLCPLLCRLDNLINRSRTYSSGACGIGLSLHQLPPSLPVHA